MKDDQFDDLLRKKLSGFASDVPAEVWERITARKRRKKLVLIFWISVLGILILLMTVGYKNLFVHSINKKNKTNTANVTRKQNSADLNNNAENEYSSKDSLLQNSGSAPLDPSTFKRSYHPKGNKNAASYNSKNHKNIYDHPLANIALSMQASNDKSNDTTEADHHKISDSTATPSKKTGNKSDSTAFIQNKETPESETHDKFLIEIFGSPFYPVNSIRSSNAEFEQLLRNSANMHLSGAVGIRFGYGITEMISAKLGATYSNVNEKISFKNSASGSEFQVTDHYQFLDVLLSISYNMKLPNSFAAAVNAGIVLNISSKFKGAIPSSGSEPINIANANVFYANRGAGLYLGVDFSKKIGNKIYLFAEPYLQGNLKNMTNSFQTFKQNIHFAGINLGFGYHFFNEK